MMFRVVINLFNVLAIKRLGLPYREVLIACATYFQNQLEQDKERNQAKMKSFDAGEETTEPLLKTSRETLCIRKGDKSSASLPLALKQCGEVSKNIINGTLHAISDIFVKMQDGIPTFFVTVAKRKLLQRDLVTVEEILGGELSDYVIYESNRSSVLEL